MTEVARLEGIIALVGAAAAVGGLKQVGAAADKTQTDLDGVEAASKRTGKEVDGFGQRLARAGRQMQDTGRMLTRRMTLPLLGLGLAVGKVGMDFEKQMSKVEAKSGASAQELERLRAMALKLGADTSFSAREAAEGMEVLAAAGMKPMQVMAAMPGLLDAAAASGESLADTSNVVANALAQFNLDASQSTRIADVLAKASNETQGSIGSMGEALKYAGTGARSLGFDLEQTTALISMMVKAGIDGSSAGTSLRMGLMKLATVPPMRALDKVADISPKLAAIWKSAAPVPEKLKAMSREFQTMDGTSRAAASALVFGTEASTAMLTVLEGGPGKIDKWTASMRNAEGEAKRMGDTMRNNLAGDIEALGGSLESAFIGVFDSQSGPLRELAQSLTEIVNAFTQADPVVQQLVVGLGGLGIVLGPMLMMFGSMATGAAALAGAVTLVSAPVIALGVAAVAAGVGLVALYRNSATARQVVQGLWDIVKVSPLGQLVRLANTAAQAMGGWGDVFRYAGIAALGFAKVTLTSMLSVVRAVDNMAGNWLQKFSTILGALAIVKPEFKGAAAAVEEMANRSRNGTSEMERAMTRDLARINGQINQLRASINGIPTTKSVSITVRQRWDKGPAPSGPTNTMATGGRVEGEGTGTSDSIPALLSNGEHVVTAREVDAMGGHDSVERWRKAALTGRVAMFAAGGAVRRKFHPADKNKDGKVSKAEHRAYGVKSAAAIEATSGLTNATIDANLAAAELTPKTDDDVKRLQERVKAALAQERKWKSYIGSASYKHLPLADKQRAQQNLASARRDLQGARDSIKRINEAARTPGLDGDGGGGVGGVDGDAGGVGGVGSSGVDQDLAAQLEQARRRAEVAEQNFRMSQAEMGVLTGSGDIGFGGGRNAWQSANGAPVNVIVQSLTGYSPEIREVVGEAAGGGFTQGGNAYRSYSGRG